MAQIPEVFRKSGDKLVNYNYEDIISGEGFITFYAGVTDESDQLLTTNTFIASGRGTFTSSTTKYTALNEKHDLTFTSSTFNNARTMKGDMMITYGAVTPTGGATSGAIKIYVDSELIASENMIALGQQLGYYLTQKIAIPETIIKAGQQLKIMFDSAGATATGYLCHDPSDEFNGTIGSYSSTHSALIIKMPFRIET